MLEGFQCIWDTCLVVRLCGALNFCEQYVRSRPRGPTEEGLYDACDLVDFAHARFLRSERIVPLPMRVPIGGRVAVLLCFSCNA